MPPASFISGLKWPEDKRDLKPYHTPWIFVWKCRHLNCTGMFCERRSVCKHLYFSPSCWNVHRNQSSFSVCTLTESTYWGAGSTWIGEWTFGQRQADTDTLESWKCLTHSIWNFQGSKRTSATGHFHWLTPRGPRNLVQVTTPLETGFMTSPVGWWHILGLCHSSQINWMVTGLVRQKCALVHPESWKFWRFETTLRSLSRRPVLQFWLGNMRPIEQPSLLPQHWAPLEGLSF